ncbi:MAG: phenylalanine--tRNA ligase subunit beta [Actinomycetota bacterium]
MKIVRSWLLESCPVDLSAEDLAELLTAKGAEVERIERPWEGLDGVVVAKVLEVRDHPNSDKLCLARVTTGSAEREVVVGVRNMVPGDLVPLAGPGARVPALPAALTAREIRGVVSDGMLCSPMELGIAPTHEGILLLEEGLAPGDDLKASLGLDDAVLDIEVTPNRADFLSVIGVAREVAAATGVPFTLPPTDVAEDDEAAEAVATVEVLDLDRCSHYLARILRDVRHTSSPIRVQARLTAAGMRPISAAVDATNYAMLEIGQPLHPFDLTLLKGPGIVVRRANEGERMVTLDGVERSFTDDDLLICDAERPVGVAGIMGGVIAEISDSTGQVLLEAASFERGGVQRTRRRIGLSTEASMRFERGVDPEATATGADRACRLMAEWCGARVLAGAVERGTVPSRRHVTMRASRATKLIGYDVSVADATEVFDRLMMPSGSEGDDVVVEVPGYRVDIEREVDLIEEVVRIQGYDRVGSTLPPVRQTGGMPEAYEFRHRVRGSLMRAGLREVWSFPFSSDADLALTGDADAIRVTNPLQSDDRWLRTRLTPGLLAAIRRNAYRQVRGAALFELGTVFRLVDGAPEERPMAALAITGAGEGAWTERREYDFFDAKGAVEALMADLGIEWSLGEPPGPLFHPGRSAFVMVDGARVGVLGEIHPRVTKSLDVPGRIAAAELEVNKLMRHAARSVEANDVPRFPPVRRDLSFVLDEQIPHAAVVAAIREAGGALVASCVLFDVHAGPPLPAGKKSLAFSVEFRDPSRTLEREEADEAVQRIRFRVSGDLGGELRGGDAEARERPPV